MIVDRDDVTLSHELRRDGGSPDGWKLPKTDRKSVPGTSTDDGKRLESAMNFVKWLEAQCCSLLGPQMQRSGRNEISLRGSRL
jgi:hypothetical protein